MHHPSTNKLSKALLTVVIVCLPADITLGQKLKSRVVITLRNPPEVSVAIEQKTLANSWSFMNSYAGSLGLGERVGQFHAMGSGGEVSVKRLAVGEFRSDASAGVVSYVVNLNPGSSADLPHVSWLAEDHGMLMLADLLPINLDTTGGIDVRFELPTDWESYSSLPSSLVSFLVDDPEKAVFVIGRDLRSISRQRAGVELRLITRGKWRFSDTDLLNVGLRILRSYQDLTNFKLRSTPTIVIAPFPNSKATGSWKAETRGSTLVLLLNPDAPWKNWRAQMAVIFTHELFHLWVPNSLKLAGEYDWFFEGFTSYIALQEALKLKLIRFQEYLNTIGRVYDSYLSSSDDKSLLELSEQRWTNLPSEVYDKGMLVAFVYDVLVRQESSGRSSLRDQYRKLFMKFANEPADANDVIIQALTSSPATSGFAKDFIESRTRIELEDILPTYGIEVHKTASRTELRISKELRDDQKKLLRTLGYTK